MAKVSARGSVKVGQHSIAWTDEDGWDHKVRITLRSDGRVLRAHDLRSPQRRDDYGSRGWHRGGYGLIAGVTIPPTIVKSPAIGRCRQRVRK